MSKTYLITGGAGFIGSCFVHQRVVAGDLIINLDKLTYSGNLDNLKSIEKCPNHIFIKGDIADETLIPLLLKRYHPDAIINFAAESHVDRSIIKPDIFVQTNVLGTEILLRKVKDWWKDLGSNEKSNFRFHHISTDEVFGTLELQGAPFTENTPYAPNSPYSASKASSDHFVRAYHHTFGLPTLISNCSNNYGPQQYPEKFIPLMILNAIAGQELPVYGNGENIRDWIFVEDHCNAVYKVLTEGRIGESYNVGGRSERSNKSIVNSLCEILDDLYPKKDGLSYKTQIVFVKDRPGHDFRYSVDCTKIEKELDWKPNYSLEKGLRKTVKWYLDNPIWVKNIKNKEYKSWLYKNYGNR